jgi:hypothetical protein
VRHEPFFRLALNAHNADFLLYDNLQVPGGLASRALPLASRVNDVTAPPISRTTSLFDGLNPAPRSRVAVSEQLSEYGFAKFTFA